MGPNLSEATWGSSNRSAFRRGKWPLRLLFLKFVTELALEIAAGVEVLAAFIVLPNLIIDRLLRFGTQLPLGQDVSQVIAFDLEIDRFDQAI